MHRHAMFDVPVTNYKFSLYVLFKDLKTKHQQSGFRETKHIFTFRYSKVAINRF